MPFKQMRVRDQDVPHLTLEWKEAIRARRRAARLYRKTNAPDDWVKLKKLRNEATRLQRKAILKELLESKGRESQNQNTRLL